MKSMLLVIVVFMICRPAVATDSKHFVIGAQNIEYYPHYSFIQSADKGYAWALMEAFAADRGITFTYLALPIKRLQQELKKGTVDFAYPDNPKWNDPQLRNQKYFSQPFATALGGTMVKTTNQGQGLSRFDSLSVPFGFTPIMWMELIHAGDVELVSVMDSGAALDMVLKGRASGADIEYHVAKHFLQLRGLDNELVLDPTLPYDEVDFTLSTLHYPSMIEALNVFISENTALVTRLKARYRLLEPKDILQGRYPASQPAQEQQSQANQ